MSASPSETTGKRGKGFNGPLIALAVVVLVLVAFFAGRFYFEPTAKPALGVSQTSGNAAIGGPFTLVDQNGETVTEADFLGRPMLVYFGYTYCPDICPTSLTRDAAAVDMLGDVGEQVVPIFITVDPARDTVEQMKSYAEFFHPRMVALTGTPEQIQAAADAYRVYFKIAREEGDPEDVYLVDHSGFSYLMGPDGTFLKHFRHDLGAAEVAEQMRELLPATAGS